MTPLDVHSEPVYDSAQRLSPRQLLREAWRYRELVELLTRREIANRYDRTLLGAAWALATPVAYACALYVIFSEVARFATPGLPFVVYVLSGVIVLNFITSTVITIAGAVVHNAVAMRRLAVPVGVFVASSAFAAVVTLAITVVALLAVQLATGTGIPLTALALPLAFLPLVIATAGVGLIVGALAAVFNDALEMARVVLTLVGFLTPIFYPLSIVPERWRFVVEVNPIYHQLRLIRALAYEGQLPPTTSVVVAIGAAAVAAALGALVFTRVRHALPSVL